MKNKILNILKYTLGLPILLVFTFMGISMIVVLFILVSCIGTGYFIIMRDNSEYKVGFDLIESWLFGLILLWKPYT